MATGRISKFAWGEWSSWIKACEDDPNYTVRLDHTNRPANLNIDSFRMMASKRAKEAGAQAHVNVDYANGVILLQFCWCERRHQGLCAKYEWTANRII